MKKLFLLLVLFAAVANTASAAWTPTEKLQQGTPLSEWLATRYLEWLDVSYRTQLQWAAYDYMKDQLMNLSPDSLVTKPMRDMLDTYMQKDYLLILDSLRSLSYQLGYMSGNLTLGDPIYYTVGLKAGVDSARSIIGREIVDIRVNAEKEGRLKAVADSGHISYAAYNAGTLEGREDGLHDGLVFGYEANVTTFYTAYQTGFTQGVAAGITSAKQDSVNVWLQAKADGVLAGKHDAATGFRDTTALSYRAYVEGNEAGYVIGYADGVKVVGDSATAAYLVGQKEGYYATIVDSDLKKIYDKAYQTGYNAFYNPTILKVQKETLKQLVLDSAAIYFTRGNEAHLNEIWQIGYNEGMKDATRGSAPQVLFSPGAMSVAPVDLVSAPLVSYVDGSLRISGGSGYRATLFNLQGRRLASFIIDSLPSTVAEGDVRTYSLPLSAGIYILRLLSFTDGRIYTTKLLVP